MCFAGKGRGSGKATGKGKANVASYVEENYCGDCGVHNDSDANRRGSSSKGKGKGKRSTKGGYGSYLPDACDDGYFFCSAEKGTGKHKGKGKAAGKGRGKIRMPRPPVDTPGEWVPLEDFEGIKSFGFFVCDECGRTWRSAHTYPQFRQGCQGCETKAYATYMWENDPDAPRDPRGPAEEDEDAEPHDQDRCEACQAGICSRARPVRLGPMF
jgi:hypothetical protein